MGAEKVWEKHPKTLHMKGHSRQGDFQAFKTDAKTYETKLILFINEITTQYA